LKQLLIIVAIGLMALLAGCSKESGQAGGGFQRPPTPVEAGHVTGGSVTDRFTTVGSIEAGESINVTSEINGIVTAIPFREGGRLKAGELIASLDDDQLKAEALRARALKDQRHSAWQRVKSVVDQGAGTPQDLDDAVAALKVAEADLALAETRLAKTRITAPFSGFAGKRHISRGAYLRAGETITDLAQITELRVTFAVPERLLASMTVGSAVSLQTTAYPDHELTGVIDVVEPQLNPVTRNVGLVARVANPDELLRPGMSATITAVLQERAYALTVPSAAVFVEGGQAFVYVIKPDSIVTRTPVSLGTRLADVVEVTEGVSDGQQVVRAGHQKLYEGAKVAPVAAPAAEAAVADKNAGAAQ
jgi:membrane fusion protein, multidrug efflux system